ncbi:hypothetical protein N9I88_01375 [Pontimonas sp.]|nr:hypothetical protein [Pontimonas sp.]MDA8901138.1 hypothetical protein [Pontimonas sp.]
MSRRREQPTSDDIRIPKFWDKAMRRELVELYFDGMDIEMLGWHFEMKAFEVYRELISLLLGVTHLEEDPSVPRFRKRWEYLEDSELIRLYRRSIPVEQIAQQLGRDAPGVAMRLINSWWVTCSPEVAKTLGLNENEVDITTEHGRESS